MNTQCDRRRAQRAVSLFWLALTACACTGTRWVAGFIGADWRLATALAIGAGLAVLVIGGCYGERGRCEPRCERKPRASCPSTPMRDSAGRGSGALHLRGFVYNERV